MKEMEYNGVEGNYTYVRQGRGLEITGYHGFAGTVEIPGELPWGEGNGEWLPVRAIAKKVFLSKKFLRTVGVPASVERIGDWAFAYCDSLREVRFGGKGVSFGKAVFMECPNLRGLYFPQESPGGQGGETQGTGALLAAAVTQMESPYLLNAAEAGSEAWLEKWDARMLTILDTQDDEGYAKQILCGEEDYESADLETYLANSRRKKVRLALLRLLYPYGLQKSQERKLKDYLLSHTKGCKTEETWLVIRDECGDRRELYELFAELGCFTKENAAAIISEAPEEYPEMKAFFLKHQAEHFTKVDFFGNLEL